MDISIVIPTCNRPELLGRCLDALASALRELPLHNIEVIATDDSSDDRTERMLALRYPWVRWNRGPRRGPAANRNAGAAAAKGSWLMFTDDDCIPDPGWCAAFLQAIGEQCQCGVFEGRTLADRERIRLDEDAPINLTGGYLWSCNLVIQRALFDRLEGFCETFPYAAMEDVDLRFRLEASRAAMTFVPDAVVIHPYRPTKGLSFVVKCGRSYVHLLERHPEMAGPTPWRTCFLNALRRCKATLRDAIRYSFRGFGFAALSLLLGIYFEVAARITARWHRRDCALRSPS